MGRELTLGAGVRQIMTDVSEVSALRFESLDVLETAGNVRVGRMRFIAKPVNEEDVKALKEGHAGIGDLVVVCQVCRCAEAEACAAAAAVMERNRLKGDACDFERVAVNFDADQLGLSGLSRLVFKGVIIDPLDCVDRFAGGIDRDGFLLPVVKGADVIETKDMIGMGMGKQDRVNSGQSGAEGLFAKVRAGINQYDLAVVLDGDARAKAAVSWIGALANAAEAPDHGNTHAGAGA